MIQKGIPKIENYNKLLKNSLFLKMEKFSNKFLEKNKKILNKYRFKWVADPLHQWSRQYEYPYVYSCIQNYVKHNENKEIKIIDAGSGVTFFPYYLASNIQNAKIECCDYDKSLESIFTKINTNYPSISKIQFSETDIHKLTFPDEFCDIIYCISVLEHTENFETIIKEFKRILKKNGLLIITFDISIDGSADIPKEKAEKLIETLEKYFPNREKTNYQKDFKDLNSDNILTTKYIKQINKKLLPWKFPILTAIKHILKFKNPKKSFKNLSCYCAAFSKNKT